MENGGRRNEAAEESRAGTLEAAGGKPSLGGSLLPGRESGKKRAGQRGNGKVAGERGGGAPRAHQQ